MRYDHRYNVSVLCTRPRKNTCRLSILTAQTSGGRDDEHRDSLNSDTNKHDRSPSDLIVEEQGLSATFERHRLWLAVAWVKTDQDNSRRVELQSLERCSPT
jgi:hypothetical protein